MTPAASEGHPNAPFSIGQASLILVLGFTGSRALGVLRNTALAGAFGAGPELDAYLAAFRLPDIIFQLIVGAALGSALLPTLASTYAQVSPRAAWRLASAALTWFTAIGAIVSAVAFAAAPQLVPLSVPGFTPEQQALTVDLTRIMLGSSVFFCASGVVTGILNARYHFLLPALAPWLYNLSIIGGALFLAAPLGIAGPAWAVTAGAALHLFVQLPALARLGMTYSPTASIRTPGVSEVLRLMGPRVLGLGTIQVNWLVSTILASTLAAGSVTALNYAWTIAMLPIGVFGMAPAIASFPALAEAAATGSWQRYRELLTTSLRFAVFLGVPGTVGLLLIREPLVALLFQRGLFDAASTELTAGVLLYYSLGLLPHAALEVIARGSYALHDTKTPLFYAVLGMISHVLFCLTLIGPLGVRGLALAMTLAALVETGGLLFALNRRTGGLPWPPMARAASKTIAASALMGGTVWLALAIAPPSHGVTSWLTAVIIAVTIGGSTYAVGSVLLNNPDITALLHRLRIRTP